MKNCLLISCFAAAMIFGGCTNDDGGQNALTGNKETYTLYAGSDYDISGQVIIEEKIDGSALVTISVTGTEAGLIHPSHIHSGNANESGEMLKLLNPVDGSTGMSTTEVGTLESGDNITYSQLISTEASIKVHLSDVAPGKNIILAGGNIGASISKENPFGRIEIAVCGVE